MDGGQKLQLLVDPSVERGGGRGCCVEDPGLCLHALEEPYKEVFSLRVFGELPFDRIGAIFGHNAAWARVTYYRAKTRIQTMLEQRK